MDLTNQLLASYVGGQIEIQNRNEGYIYRGQIETANLQNEDIVVTLDWVAKGEGYPPLPVSWIESNNLLYEANLTIYSISNIGPGSEGGDDRISFDSAITGELVVLYPPNGSKLDHSNVVTFGPKSEWQKDNCLFCENPATLQAMYSIASIRCCENAECKERAVKTALIAGIKTPV